MVQQRIGQQRFRRGATARDQARAAHGQDLAADDIVRAAPGPEAFAKTHRGVEFGRGKVIALAVRQELHMDIGPKAHEGGQARDQPTRAEGRHTGQVERAALPLVRDQLDGGGLDLPQAGLDLGQVAAASLGQDQALPDPQE
ncbi:hypothetical protein D3C72_1529260 [compost metagenome]